MIEMTERIPIILAKIDAIEAGMHRLERLIEAEIRDLKNEQITDLKESITRIADDQRRLWEAAARQQDQLNTWRGGLSAIHYVVLAVGAIIGSIAGILGRMLWK
jgi:hypothetical protein